MKILPVSMALLLGLLSAPAATAGEECCGAPERCARCGCHAACQKYCRVVPAVKEIKKHVWEVKCEDFCPPMPGCAHGRGGCAQDGGGCGQEGCGGRCGCDPKGCAVCAPKPCVKPDCGCARSRKILVKKEVTCKIDCWKCEVVYACGGCGAGCCAEGFAPAAEGAAPAAGPAPTPAPRLDQPSPPLPPAPPMPKRAKTTGFLPEPN